ncbi:MAG: hypothetical protein EZS28_034950 [Streblomastix strix]|uniref:Uncharacterized protein n=1 Tax=Streblomastix strix TaxID=222440 RepID=A0A5J4UH71_9EUKA|nr:MAG: hypothetical protein EZS28_034950 [Streblomastix strix]
MPSSVRAACAASGLVLYNESVLDYLPDEIEDIGNCMEKVEDRQFNYSGQKITNNQFLTDWEIWIATSRSKKLKRKRQIQQNNNKDEELQSSESNDGDLSNEEESIDDQDNLTPVKSKEQIRKEKNRLSAKVSRQLKRLRWSESQEEENSSEDDDNYSVQENVPNNRRLTRNDEGTWVEAPSTNIIDITDD